ncbi:hypothetical protein IscW_ISCW002524, partial [Ixodes scapularis]
LTHFFRQLPHREAVPFSANYCAKHAPDTFFFFYPYSFRSGVLLLLSYFYKLHLYIYIYIYIYKNIYIPLSQTWQSRTGRRRTPKPPPSPPTRPGASLVRGAS